MEERILNIAEQTGITELLEKSPYELSGVFLQSQYKALTYIYIYIFIDNRKKLLYFGIRRNNHPEIKKTARKGENMKTKTYHLICYFLFALALVLIGTIGSAGILVAACAAEDTMGSAVNRLCELHLIVPLVLGIVILLIGLLMLLPQVWPVNLLERPAEGEEKAAAPDTKEA